ncbi:peptidyl-prolyl cis-trans isomerase G-like [Argiope bruennichi]|uniref:peptidyl-prolyl cis-trans isomerase G-like n=1 Tax=Argiope bruennichi TaxID=94029 RepID=UPI002493F6FC|nr:peptidyl-prolyl cis-trans isomerase G-like [Argiope bruennichi]
MTVDKKYSPRCFLDIEIDGEYAGRIVIELFADACPITCENFRALCTGEKGLGKTTAKPLHYKGAPFHRVVKNFVIQGGDFVAGNGTGGESIYGGQFKDENFDIPHDKPFLLSMSNRGKDSNGSQFFITTNTAPHLNGKHTVFGEVISGNEVVTKIENIKTDQSCRPVKDVKISNCGELVLKIKQKSKKVTESSSGSESEEVKEKKRKKKHKHQKKHKKEKKERKESSSSKKVEEEGGLIVDPEEIPSIPVNNFLMRRTSPNPRETNRRQSSRDSYSYHRPARSRSGRKIKGRGFMRYRTPSRSASRSGSETPPHWKQAQARLRNIKDVVLPAKGSPLEENPLPEDEEEEEDSVPKSNLLSSRLGVPLKSNEQLGQKDARNIMRQNRRRRDWSPDTSPPPNNKSSSNWVNSGSPLRSTVVVASNFQRDTDRHNYRRNDRREGDRFGEHDSRSGRNADRKSDAHGSRKETERFSGNSKGMTEAQETLRYDKASANSSKFNSNKEDVSKTSSEEVRDRKKHFKSLTSDLFKYTNEKIRVSESSDEEGLIKDEAARRRRDSKKEESPQKISRIHSEKNSEVQDNDLYQKDSSPESKIQESIREGQKKEVIIPFLSETEDTIPEIPEIRSPTKEETAPSSDATDTSTLHRKIVIPGICDDSNSNDVSMESEPPQSNKDSTTVNKGDTVSEDRETEHEKRRWDVQQTVFDSRLPDVIPLPEETRPNRSEENDDDDDTVPEMSSPKRFGNSSPAERASQSEDAPPVRPTRESKSDSEETKRKDRSRSRSPISKQSSSKRRDRSRSSTKRRSSPSPDRRRRRRSKSKSPSRSNPSRRPYSGRRSRSVERRRSRSPRRAPRPPRYSDLRNRSPDRRTYKRRYGKSPQGVRARLGGRRSRSRSPARRRRGRKSSSSSSRSSSSSSSRRDRRKRKRGKRSSSSSSSKSKSSD